LTGAVESLREEDAQSGKTTLSAPARQVKVPLRFPHDFRQAAQKQGTAPRFRSAVPAE